MITAIQSEQEFDKGVIEKEGFVLLTCHASWCRYCKVMAPTVEAASEDFQDKVSFYSMDVDQMEEIAESFDLVGVPTYVMFKDGKEVGRIVGYNQKDTFYNEIKKIIENH